MFAPKTTGVSLGSRFAGPFFNIGKKVPTTAKSEK
jgi:hypothetical protein